MRIIRSFTLAVFLAFSLATLPAAAGNDAQVTLSVVEPMAGGSGTFSLSGALISEGAICSGGIVNTIAITGGMADGSHSVTTILREFTCSDGSGSFIIEFTVNKSKQGNIRWSVVSGDGVYTGLSGRGSIKTTTTCDCYTVDVYQGRLRLG